MAPTASLATRTSFRWRKLGLVIRPTGSWWMQSHAMMPTVESITGSHVRVYVSGRDRQNRSHIGSVVLDVARPEQPVVEVSAEPVLTLGELGCFDDNGVTPSCVVTHADKTFLYYVGWNPGSTVRVHLFGGLAISEDGGRTFRRFSRAPILERTALEPFLNTAPFVLFDEDRWRMYYVAGTGWVHRDLPRYHIRYAESRDGCCWERRGIVCLDFGALGEYALARPWVRKEGGRYEMWFSYKGDAYRIGYAESTDGIHWTRLDAKAGLGVSSSGWDSVMVEYACVFDCGGATYLLYNGNDYGRDGAGLAMAE